MNCDNCGDNIAINGLCQVPIRVMSEQSELPTLYKVEHFSSPIPLFEIEKDVPASVQIELLGAFSYFHIDTNSSASKLRRAIEQFCIQLGAEGKNLYRQLDSLKTQYPIEISLLDTLRLVGNEGTHSHGLDVTEDDLLTAFKIFKEVITIFRKQRILSELQSDQITLNEKFDNKIINKK